MFALLFLWCAVMPVAINPGKGQAIFEESTDPVTSVQSAETESAEECVQPKSVGVTDGGKTVEYELEDYVALALTALCEEGTPAEALKAQAVAIRSVVCFRLENGSHEGGVLCAEEGHCFPLADSARGDCARASEDTCGLLLTYEGKAAYAASHLSSCGCTESAAAVYGDGFPYLKSVTVRDESAFAAYKTEKRVTAEEYTSAFSEYRTSFEDNNMLGNITYTGSKRVYTVEAGGLCFKGSTFAALFGLPSTHFTVNETDEGFSFTCLGSGDGVGMSRLSARIMAGEGMKYDEILSHFYPGTKLSRIKGE